MRRLHTRVNLVPVIAKADTLTDEEVTQFKARILNDLAHHRIEIYQAPQYEMEDEETLAENEEILVSRAGAAAVYLSAGLTLRHPSRSPAQDPVRRRRFGQARLRSGRPPSARPRVPVGHDRSRQRGALRLCQAAADARPDAHGRVEGAHDEGPV